MSETAMDRWVGTFSTREAMAGAYARLLYEYGTDWGGWPVLNLAIVDRWSRAGLVYVKAKAWETFQEVYA